MSTPNSNSSVEMTAAPRAIHQPMPQVMQTPSERKTSGALSRKRTTTAPRSAAMTNQLMAATGIARELNHASVMTASGELASGVFASKCAVPAKTAALTAAEKTLMTYGFIIARLTIELSAPRAEL